MAHLSYLLLDNDEDPSTELPSISDDSQDSQGSNQTELLTTLGTVYNTNEAKRSPIESSIMGRLYSSFTSMVGKLYSAFKAPRHTTETKTDESVSSDDSTYSDL